MPKVPKICRRSRRLENIIPKSSIGNFYNLPVEIFHLILSYLSVDDLSRLTITSKMIRDAVDNFLTSKSGMKIALPFCLLENTSQNDNKIILNHFHQLGIFMKRTTCLYSTKIRLETVEEFILQLTCTSGKNCRCLHKCIALNYFGKFVHTIISGWDENELIIVFNKIQTKSKIHKYQQAALKSPPGFMFNLEIILRLFYRKIYFEPEERPEMRGFWLSRILTPLPIIHQAKLLIIIFGHVDDDRIQWNSSMEGVAENAIEAQLHYNGLAQALLTLRRHKEWHMSAVLSIVEEIIELPLDWLPENVATLLYLCGDEICVAYLANKAHNGHYNELSILITCLTLVSEKFGNDVSYVTGVVYRICSVISTKTGKIKLWTSIADSFRHTIIDILQYYIENEDPNLVTLLDAFTHLFKYVLRQNLT